MPVVFVHGAISDHRTWDAQRDPTSRNYRYAFDQRYFGPAPWPDEGKALSVATHANDLAAFLRPLDVGPVHLVGWSYGANVALVLVVQHPALVSGTGKVDRPADVRPARQGDRHVESRRHTGIAVAIARRAD